MGEQEERTAPTDPSVDDDLLAPEHDEKKASEDADLETNSAAADAEEETRPQSSVRSLVRLGWTALAVFTVIGVLIVAELFRISSGVNNNGCVLKAQAQLMQALGPGVTAPYAGLDRVVALDQLKKCS